MFARNDPPYPPDSCAPPALSCALAVHSASTVQSRPR
jgi:hypothetical protein